MKRRYSSPFVPSLLAGFSIPALITGAYAIALDATPLPVWLATINLMVMVLLGKDKLAATSQKARTPEITLLALTFAGGTPGMLVGRKVFNHKTSKQSFIAALWGTIALQAGCIWYFWPTVRQWL